MVFDNPISGIFGGKMSTTKILKAFPINILYVEKGEV